MMTYGPFVYRTMANISIWHISRRTISLFVLAQNVPQNLEGTSTRCHAKNQSTRARMRTTLTILVCLRYASNATMKQYPPLMVLAAVGAAMLPRTIVHRKHHTTTMQCNIVSTRGMHAAF